MLVGKCSSFLIADGSLVRDLTMEQQVLNQTTPSLKRKHRTEERRKLWGCSNGHSRTIQLLLSFVLFNSLFPTVSANTPPRFLLEGGSSSEVGGDIVVRLKEGPDTPPGTKILQLRGFDQEGDPLTFGVQERDGSSPLLRVENHRNSEASVYLNRVLDAEVASEYQVLLTLTDGHLGAGNFITQSLLVLVEDVNDNPPVFQPFPHSVQVEEHSAVPTVLATVEARDRDSGIFGQVVYDLLKEGGDSELFSVETTADGRGVISVVGDLDFEERSVYQLKVLAMDRAASGGANVVNTATAAILVRVMDVADQPPEFISVPSVTRVSEDAPKFSEVLRVRAVDGDRAIGNPIAYSIVSGPADIFAINADTGIVYTQVALDRESPRSSNGAFILGIEAKEVGGVEEPATRTEVTIIVEDVNDETPTFRSSSYVAEISENSRKGAPVTFVGANAVPEVFDHDRGSNGTFGLFLEGDGGMFEVLPTEVINEASFTIRVRDAALLDFEALKTVNFSLVARESAVGNAARESRVSVTVHVRDQNDNSPEFSQDRYEVDVAEDAAPGSTVAWIRASDNDSGLFGTEGVRFTRLNGPLADFLTLDPQTGIITLSDDDAEVASPLDREVTGIHFLTVEARDELGKGNRNSVELLIRVRDVNDNAPTFRQLSYEASLAENLADFAAPFFVQADDKDENGTENAMVRYRIVEGDTSGNFTVDPVTGRLRPSGPIDFEKMNSSAEERSFRLMLRAYDLGTPPLQSDVPVVIFVSDKNDHAPKFEREFYQVTVDEDAAGEVVQVRASDGDGSPPNNRLVYRIRSGARDMFVIDAETGIMSVRQGANLDPDLVAPRTTSYLMEVSAVDGGIGDSQLTGIARVNVTVNDVNNKEPVFENRTKVLNVSENVSRGFLVTKLVAFDSDSDSKLAYSMDLGVSSALSETDRQIPPRELNLTQLFELDRISGDLRVVGDLDREKLETLKLVVVAEDLNARTKPQTATATLLITVLDANDNSPEFSQSLYQSSIPENSSPGTAILAVLAVDADKNKTIDYSLEGPAKILEHLELNALSGEVTVGSKNKIDREFVSWLNFSIRATDAGFPPRSAVAAVAVAVTDENDNSPVFREETIKLTVSEATPKGTVIAQLLADDLDSGEYGKVTYFLDGRSSLFKIHPDTGELSLSEALDREREESHELIVQAYDNYQLGFATGTARVAFAQVSIEVTDANDEKPVFIEAVGKCEFVSEFHELTEPVLTVRATDADDPETVNGQLKFEIKGGNDLQLFRIESSGPTSASVFPDRSLKGFFGNYTLTVEAVDGGVPSNKDTATYGICVQDFNDNAPRFISPTSNFTIRVPENASIGSEVIQVHATDADVGINGEVRYRLREDPSGNHLHFHLDSVTGMLTLKKELDREKQRLYALRVEAHDLGVPTSLQSDLDLAVHVRNVNDCQPQFPVDEFVANFTEHKSPGSERVLLVGAVDRDEEDEDQSHDVCYFIVEGNEFGIFELLSQKRELILTRELDREKQAEYLLTVKATEECIAPPDGLLKLDPADDSLLRVRVLVIDIDDNPPIFVKSVFTGGISTDIDFGTAFMQVRAEDKDMGVNAELEYSLDGEIIPSAKSEGLEGIRSPPFLVDPQTGEVKLNFDPQKSMKGHFDFEIRAFDHAGHVDKAKVQIYLLREDQRVMFVMRGHPGEIRSRMDGFLTVMTKVTDAIVNVDAFKVHENEDGSVDKTKTDVLMHLVNRRDNSVMEVPDILKLIDYRTEELDELFREFDVINTEGVDPSFVRKATSEAVVVLWLLSTCIFLVLLLILVVSLCLHQRSKYLRKLRAATAVAFGDAASAVSVVNKREGVPNTNRHASEGSNPVWMTGVGYTNFELSREEEHDDELISTGNRLNHYQLAEEDVLDSLDANVLNDSLVDRPKHNKSKEEEEEEEDAGYYAASHFSNGGSTIRVGGDKGDSARSSSSGLGSGASRGRLTGFGGASKNMTISALFPPQMPPVEKPGRYGRTVYDNDDIPRTEL